MAEIHVLMLCSFLMGLLIKPNLTKTNGSKQRRESPDLERSSLNC